MRVAVSAGRGSVSSPSGVSDAAVRVEDLCEIQVGLVDEFLQLGNLAHLLEGKNLVLLVTIDCKAGRVIAAVFETREA